MQGATPAQSAPPGAQPLRVAGPATQARYRSQARPDDGVRACECQRRPDQRCPRAGVPCTTPGVPRSLVSRDPWSPKPPGRCRWCLW
eukprot:4440178-Alexandrium_andersonii.AAC.1